MIFPHYTHPRKKPDVYEANRVDTELAIYKELQHNKICRQTSYEVFSDEESEDDAYWFLWFFPTKNLLGSRNQVRKFDYLFFLTWFLDSSEI